jgi:hypothetical protein
MLNETDTSARRFFLQAIDADSNCPVYEVGFSVSDVGMLIALIGEGLSDIRCAYDLPLATTLKIVSQYDVSFDPGGHAVRLRPSSAHDNLPYRVHTGRELLLMLQGVKPLAVFSRPVEQVLTEERFFEQHVAIGRFVKREYSIPILLQRKDDIFVEYMKRAQEERMQRKER